MIGAGSTVDALGDEYWPLEPRLEFLWCCGGGKRAGTLVLLIVPVVGGCCLPLLAVVVVGAATDGEGGIRFALASTKPKIN